MHLCVEIDQYFHCWWVQTDNQSKDILSVQKHSDASQKVFFNPMFILYMVILCPRLSGESPFQGNSDAETFALVTAASYEFDEESFEDISDQAKDFISSLLKKDQRLVCFLWKF